MANDSGGGKKKKFNWTSVVTEHKRQLASLNSGVTMSGVTWS